MHLEVPAPPKHLQQSLRAMYNGKHRVWATMVLVIVDLRGRLLFVSDPYTKTESQVLNDLNIKKMINDADVGVIGDALYCFNRVSDKRVDDIDSYWTIGPTTLHRVGNLLHVDDNSMVPQAVHDEMRRVINSTKLASQIRIVVENTIRRLRCWRILKDKFRSRGVWHVDTEQTGQYSLVQKHVLQIVAFLTQRQLLIKPCRPANWQQKGRATNMEYDYSYAPKDNDNNQNNNNSKHTTRSSTRSSQKLTSKKSTKATKPLNPKQQEKRITSIYEEYCRQLGKKKRSSTSKKKKVQHNDDLKLLEEFDTDDLSWYVNYNYTTRRSTTSRQRGEKRDQRETLRVANDRLDLAEKQRKKRKTQMK